MKIFEEEITAAAQSRAAYWIAPFEETYMVKAKKDSSAVKAEEHEQFKKWLKKYRDDHGIDEPIISLPPTIDFTYYLHGDDFWEHAQWTFEKAGYPNVPSELIEKMGEPFYEIGLKCTVDTTTGEVTINSVE